jgi:hypothetical protein
MGTKHLYTIWSFSVCKRGHSDNKNEDAVSFGTLQGWLAIADGATETDYSRDWARLLVKSFPLITRVKFPVPIEDVRVVLSSLHKRWHKTVPWDWLASRDFDFVEKARQGAFATFLGVKLDGYNWSATGIGDCNLFILNPNGNLLLSHPARTSREFGTSPFLVPSVSGAAIDKALKALWWETGKWEKGCQIVICTDAVAAHLLKCEENDLPEWKELVAAQTPEEFAAWVEKAREAGMRNDDSTVAIAHLAESETGASGQ